MPRIQQEIFTNCTDPDRDLEFNRWYTHTHLPDLSRAPGFVGARRFRNALPTPGAATYKAVYEFDADDAATVLRDLTRLALEAFDAGRHIDCIEGVPAANTPLGMQWVEIEPDSLEPLEDVGYPGAPRAVRRQMEQLIEWLGDAERFERRMRSPSTRLLFGVAGLYLRGRRIVRDRRSRRA